MHVLHTMGDTFAVLRTLEGTSAASAVIVGAGYVGLEMADALISRGLAVTQIEQLPEVPATVDTELGALVHAELAAQGVNVSRSCSRRSRTSAVCSSTCSRRSSCSARRCSFGVECPSRSCSCSESSSSCRA